MSKTLIILAGLVIVYLAKATTTTTTPATLQETSTVESELDSNTPTPSPAPEIVSKKTVKLEKEEEEIDKQINEEILRRKNQTYMVPKKHKPGDVFSVVHEATCNDDSTIDLSRPGTLALCTCGADEILVNGSCTYYAPGTSIDMEKFIFHMEETPAASLRVRVQDVPCNNEKPHLNLTFTKGQFFLRNRGDVVLTDKAGELKGLRITDYCVDHFLDQNGDLSWKMKACVPYPSIPRCCPANEILRNGTCHTGPSPGHLIPPIQVDPRGTNPIGWYIIGNHINTIQCEPESLKTVGLDVGGSFLIALPNGLAYRWYSSDPKERPKYFFCPDFCIDGRQGVDGSIEYLANFCHAPPKEINKEICKTKSCIQKCCKKGEIMSLDHYRCIKVKGQSFNPPVTGNISDYEVVTGRPACSIHFTELNMVTIDSEGNLHHQDYAIPSKDYCLDTFAKQGNLATEALICPSSSTSFRTWWLVRPIIFPICQIISLIFLGITVVFYLLAPVLLKQGGWHQLSYVLSLMLAYASTFSVNVYDLNHGACITVALLMQLGFLSTFFWLTVMCFDIEGKLRSLRHFRAYIPHHSMAYVAFGFGGPLFICMITLIMQVAVPYGVPGIIKPSIGITKCWFRGDYELLIYFYGPIAFLFICNIGLIISTAYNYNKIEKGALGMMMKSQAEEAKQSGASSSEYDRQKQTKKNFGDFKHTFLLLALMCFCWITEVLSWKIPPPELWALSDTLNSLQGLFIFIIFLYNRRNRKILKKRHPMLFSVFQPIKTLFQLMGFRKSPKFGDSADAAGRSREPSISSEFSDLSDNYKPAEPTAS